MYIIFFARANFKYSASGLTIHGIKYLVGRIFVLNLFPLSFEEFLRYKNDALFGIYVEKRDAINAHILKNGELPDIGASLLEMLLEKTFILHLLHLPS